MSGRRSLPLILLLSATLVAPTRADGAQRKRPIRLPASRALAVSIVPRLTPAPTLDDIFAAYDLAISAGAHGNFVSYRWSELEPSPSTYKLDELRGSLGYSAVIRGMKVLLGIQVLNTTAKETPADLVPVAFDSDEMKQRFHALIDSMASELRSQVAYLSIGNEVDVYLTQHPAEWNAYRAFYADAADYVRSVAPNVKIGVTATYGGAKGVAAHDVTVLNGPSDVVILTYYPLRPDFSVYPASVAAADITSMVELAGGKPLVLQEVGYPTSSLLGSSDMAQAEFVTNVFDSWQANAARIPFLNFFALHDFTPDLCQAAAGYYGLPDDTKFREYLCTLGLRFADGSPKPAWETFRARGAVIP